MGGAAPLTCRVTQPDRTSITIVPGEGKFEKRAHKSGTADDVMDKHRAGDDCGATHVGETGREKKGGETKRTGNGKIEE